MIYEALENLIQYGIKKELILDCDIFVIKNQLMEILFQIGKNVKVLTQRNLTNL